MCQRIRSTWMAFLPRRSCHELVRTAWLHQSKSERKAPQAAAACGSVQPVHLFHRRNHSAIMAAVLMTICKASWRFSGLLESFRSTHSAYFNLPVPLFPSAHSACGSRCGSGRRLCVKEAADRLRRHISFCHFSLIIDSGDLFNKSFLLLAGLRP